MPRASGEYFAYRGEEIVACGTVDEISKELGIDTKICRWYATSAAKRREAETYRKTGKGRMLILERVED
ncbi:hypothetical protein [Eremococcus coleocola]|uniref:Uncharacterized protein n=1 Tax=Eremococcus coleocola ACS-139-V-Col8 TaxID=908337 RepID=E4KQJ6_9LACT|nr:hypothetical protein [Eremococcus coleocola]EFR30686.1 hypothetical protein HMPREF9257_0554 [Eremococcus coleocola ACS-139-V-Col8]